MIHCHWPRSELPTFTNSATRATDGIAVLKDRTEKDLHNHPLEEPRDNSNQTLDHNLEWRNKKIKSTKKEKNDLFIFLKKTHLTNKEKSLINHSRFLANS